MRPLTGDESVAFLAHTIANEEPVQNLLMARYGAVCDNVQATEVLLADGRLVTANPREHADLFWAIRGGGGGNVGIVATFEYQLVRLNSVCRGFCILQSLERRAYFASTAT